MVICKVSEANAIDLSYKLAVTFICFQWNRFWKKIKIPKIATKIIQEKKFFFVILQLNCQCLATVHMFGIHEFSEAN